MNRFWFSVDFGFDDIFCDFGLISVTTILTLPAEAI
jgi:hypothetical protein